jgi:hypothetical protein
VTLTAAEEETPVLRTLLDISWPSSPCSLPRIPLDEATTISGQVEVFRLLGSLNPLTLSAYDLLPVRLTSLFSP